MIVEAENVALDFDLAFAAVDEVTVMDREEFLLNKGNAIALFVVDHRLSDEESPECVPDGVEGVPFHVLDELLSGDCPEFALNVEDVFFVHVFDG